jgi:predicted phage-related endonuclease
MKGLYEPEMNLQMKVGTHLEPIVARLFREQTGFKLKKADFVRHPVVSYFGCTPDYEIIGQNALLECKTAGYFSGQNFGAGGSDQIPDQYVIQCQWQLAITGKELCYLAVLIDNSRFEIFKISRDEELIKMLGIRAKEFYHNHFLADEPPLLSGRDPDSQWVKREFSYDNGGMTNTDEAHDEIAVQLIKEDLPELDRLTVEVERKKNLLKGFMGEASILESSVGNFSWKFSEKSNRRTFLTPYKTNKA